MGRQNSSKPRTKPRKNNQQNTRPENNPLHTIDTTITGKPRHTHTHTPANPVSPSHLLRRLLANVNLHELRRPRRPLPLRQLLPVLLLAAGRAGPQGRVLAGEQGRLPPEVLHLVGSGASAAGLLREASLSAAEGLEKGRGVVPEALQLCCGLEFGGKGVGIG